MNNRTTAGVPITANLKIKITQVPLCKYSIYKPDRPYNLSGRFAIWIKGRAIPQESPGIAGF
jgi:hypothetical protein